MDVALPLIVALVVGVVTVLWATLRLPAIEKSWLRLLLVVALILRLGVATMFATVPSMRFSHEDADGVETSSLQIAKAWRGEGPPVKLSAVGTNLGMHYLTASLYFVFGPYRILASLFNSIIGVLVVFLAYRLTRGLFHPLVARRAALLCAFMPSMILWSAVALKDTPMTFLIILSLSSCVSLKQRFSVAAVVGMVLPIIGIYYLRFYMVYFIIPAILLSLFLERVLRFVSGFARNLIVAGILGGLVVGIGFTGRLEQTFEMASLKTVSKYRQGMAITAQSGFAHDVDISTPTKAISFLPLGMAYLLLSPFPWQITSQRSLYAMPEALFWWLLIPAFVRGVVFAVRRRSALVSPILLFTFIVVVMYSLMLGNVGAAFRMRAQVFVFLFIFAALGQIRSFCRRRGLDEQLVLGEAAAAPQPAAA